MIATLITATAATLVAAPATGLFGYRAVKRARLAASMKINTPNGVDESGFVRIGGIDQWVSVRGEDRRNPVLLEIHGGPGSSNLPLAHRARSWERHFTVVRWDQRGAGRTFAAGGAAAQGELSLDRLYRDAIEVTEHVRARLGVDRVLLVAMSFGSIVGLRLARNRPDLYSAYVGTDQNIVGGGRRHAAFDGLRRRVAAANKPKELSFLDEIGPDATAWTAKQWSEFNKLCATRDPLTYDTFKTVVMRSLWFSPLNTLAGLPRHLKAMDFAEKLGPEAMRVDEYAEGTRFRIPFFVFQGDQDAITPPEAAERFCRSVTAPVVEYATIREASHFAAYRHPEQFGNLLLSRVLPRITAQSTTV